MAGGRRSGGGAQNLVTGGYQNTTTSYTGFRILLGAGNISAGNISVDTNTLFMDATNNRVGIGTSSPSSPLHISASNGAAIDGETFPKGVTIYGRWTSFKLSSGLVIAYRG